MNPPSNPGAQDTPASTSLPGVEAPRRGPVYGARYAVATDHHLASLAAMGILQRGGNAVDAAIAASAVLVVTKPQRNQLGGDAFMLIWRRREGSVDCLNAGGLAPRNATPERFPQGIAALGPASSSVPGLVDAWIEAHRTYATLPLDTLLAPAIRHAADGFAASMRLSQAMTMLPSFDGPGAEELRRVFLKGGREPYREGEPFRQPDLAETLRRIADDGREGFYAGEVASGIARAMAEGGGLIDEGDLEQPAALWHEPIVTSYAGCDVYEQALPSQGIVLLEALNIAESFPIRDWGLGSADAVHVLVEATKLAFADSRRYVADPLVDASVPVERLLSKEHARARAAVIDPRRARAYPAATLRGDTTQFAVADEDIAVAFIQSIYSPWGSRFVIPGTGILMNNRLLGFSLDPAAANVLAPGKRTVHTLNTFLALRDGRLVAGGGTPGGDYQVQNNLQTLVAVLDWDLDLQSTADMPRWVTIGDSLALESRFAASVIADLASRGHNPKVLAAWDANICRANLIASTPDGGWAAASDLRGEGAAMAV